MSRSGWRVAPLRRLLLVSVAVLVPLLAGCEAGNNAPTVEFHPPTDGATTVVGDLSIRNVFILGAPLGSRLHPGQSASLFFAIVNTGKPDRLLSISAPGSAASVRLAAGTVSIATARPVLLTGPQPEAYLVGLTRQLTNGSAIRLVLHFQVAGAVPLEVPVMTRAAQYATLSPPPSPSPSTAAHVLVRGRHRIVVTPASPTPTPSPS